MVVSRSKWKGPITNLQFSLKKKYKIPVKVHRSSNITPNCVGFNFLIYNGKSFSPLEVTIDMIGHKFGEFSITRQKFKFNK